MLKKKMRDKLFSVIENELHLHSSQHLEVDMTDDVSKGWKKLIVPSMLVGVLGYIVGNYCGTLVWLVLT